MKSFAVITLVLFLSFSACPAAALASSTPEALATAQQKSSAVTPTPKPSDDANRIRANAFRSGRRTYRAPRSGYTGVTPGTTRSGQRPGANQPGTRAPVGRTNPFGGFFGGLFAGTLLGGLLNPFGGFGGLGFGGINIVGLLFWAALIYVAFRVVRRIFAYRR